MYVRFELKIEGDAPKFALNVAGEYNTLQEFMEAVNKLSIGMPKNVIVETPQEERIPTTVSTTNPKIIYTNYLPNGKNLQQFVVEHLEEAKREKRDIQEEMESIKAIVIGHIKDKSPSIDVSWLASKVYQSVHSIKSKWDNGIITATSSLDESGAEMGELTR